MDPYAYVGDNPEGRTDPTGHCWPFCTAIFGAIIGAVVGVAVTTVRSLATTGQLPSAGEVLQSAAAGAVSGAIIGVTGPGVSVVSAIGLGALSGAAGGAVGQVVGNALSGKGWNHLGDGVLQASVEGAIIGGITGGLLKGGSFLFNRFAGQGLRGAAATIVDGIRYLSTRVGEFGDIAGSNPTLDELTSRLPSDAVNTGFRTNTDIPAGYKWEWTDDSGNSCIFYCHDINSRAPSGSNSSLGWTARFNQSATAGWQDPNGWMDTNGNIPINGYRLNSTHWPMRLS